MDPLEGPGVLTAFMTEDNIHSYTSHDYPNIQIIYLLIYNICKAHYSQINVL